MSKITIDRSAVEKALEALEDVDGPITALLGGLLGSPDADAPGAKVRAAITAFRAALAEQCQCGDRPAAECPGAWEPGCDLGANQAHAKVHEPQEPFGWVTVRRLSQRFENHADQYQFYPARRPPYLDNVDECHAVYTHPAPQRQPLTDEEILAMVKTAPALHTAEAEWLHVARAIERAHGIGGQDEQV